MIERLEQRRLFAVPRFDHVVVAIEENHSYGQIIGQSAAPYINQLANAGALMTNSHAIGHPSEPNYLAFFSGSTQGVTDDNVHVFTGKPTLGGELKAAGLTFTGYAESPSVFKHSPWSAFVETQSMGKDFSAFPTDFTQLPTVCYVVPNQANDMHDGTIQTGDAWLKTHLDSYAQWAKSHNSLLIVTWDEDARNTTTNDIATIFYGAHVKQTHDATNINHYNVLRTIEDSYGLTHAANAAVAAPISTIWTAPQQPGDANGDGTVNTADFAILAANFAQSGKTFAHGDFDGDGRVTTIDFNILAANFGKTVPVV